MERNECKYLVNDFISTANRIAKNHSFNKVNFADYFDIRSLIGLIMTTNITEDSRFHSSIDIAEYKSPSLNIELLPKYLIQNGSYLTGKKISRSLPDEDMDLLRIFENISNVLIFTNVGYCLLGRVNFDFKRTLERFSVPVLGLSNNAANQTLSNKLLEWEQESMITDVSPYNFEPIYLSQNL